MKVAHLPTLLLLCAAVAGGLINGSLSRHVYKSADSRSAADLPSPVTKSDAPQGNYKVLTSEADLSKDASSLLKWKADHFEAQLGTSPFEAFLVRDQGGSLMMSLLVDDPTKLNSDLNNPDTVKIEFIGTKRYMDIQFSYKKNKYTIGFDENSAGGAAAPEPNVTKFDLTIPAQGIAMFKGGADTSSTKLSFSDVHTIPIANAKEVVRVKVSVQAQGTATFSAFFAGGTVAIDNADASKTGTAGLTWYYVGGAIGGAVLIGVIIAVVCCVQKKRKKKAKERADKPTDVSTATAGQKPVVAGTPKQDDEAKAGAAAPTDKDKVDGKKSAEKASKKENVKQTDKKSLTLDPTQEPEAAVEDKDKKKAESAGAASRASQEKAKMKDKDKKATAVDATQVPTGEVAADESKERVNQQDPAKGPTVCPTQDSASKDKGTEKKGPRVFPRTAKGNIIAGGKKVGKGEYPTMDDVLSDWESAKDGVKDKDGGMQKKETEKKEKDEAKIRDAVDEKDLGKLSAAKKEDEEKEEKRKVEKKAKAGKKTAETAKRGQRTEQTQKDE